MLWAGLHFPLLPLQAIVRGDPGHEPLAVAAGETRPRLIALNAPAWHAGVRPGMAGAGALALAPQLAVHPRRPAAEAQALREVAQWALQFSPSVSLAAEAGLLLEVGAGLKLFGGLEALLGTIERTLPELGFSATLAAAPTPSAALMLARAGRTEALIDPARLHARLAPLPVEVAGCDDESVQMLADLGVHTLGELLTLPRDGLVRRFGRELLETLDRALGRIPDPRPPFVAPEQFQARIELPAPAWEVEALLFAFRRLIAGLRGWLLGRGLGALRLRLELVHEECAPSVLVLNLSTPSRDSAHLGALVRERLERTQLPDRVEAIGLSAGITAPLAARDRSLFPGAEAAEEAQLIERLCARLGDEAVRGLRPRADHRPELAWHAGSPAAAGAELMPPGPRPLWLLADPQPLQQFLSGSQAPIVLMDGPERIESGWWEGRDVRRDYFVARTRSGQTLWVFNQRDTEGWHVHGIFA